MNWRKSTVSVSPYVSLQRGEQLIRVLEWAMSFEDGPPVAEPSDDDFEAAQKFLLGLETNVGALKRRSEQRRVEDVA